MANNEGISWGSAEEDNPEDDEYESRKKSDKKPAPINLSSLLKEQSERATSSFAEIFNIEEKNKKDKDEKEENKKKKKSESVVKKSEPETVTEEKSPQEDSAKDVQESKQTEELPEKNSTTEHDPTQTSSIESQVPDDITEEGEIIAISAAEDISQEVEREATLEDARRRIEEVEQRIADRHIVKKEPENTPVEIVNNDLLEEDPEPTYGGAKFGASSPEASVISDSVEKELEQEGEPVQVEDEVDNNSSKSLSAKNNQPNPVIPPPSIPPPFNPNIMANNPNNFVNVNAPFNNFNQTPGSTYIDNRKEVTEVRTTSGPALVSFLAGEFFSRRRDRKLAGKIDKNEKISSRKIENIDRRLDSHEQKLTPENSNSSTEAQSIKQIIENNRYMDTPNSQERSEFFESSLNNARYETSKRPHDLEPTLPDVPSDYAETSRSNIAPENNFEQINGSSEDSTIDKYKESRQGPPDTSSAINQIIYDHNDKSGVYHDQATNQPSNTTNLVNNSMVYGSKPISSKKTQEPLTIKDYRDSVVAGSAIGAVMLIIFAVVYYFVS